MHADMTAVTIQSNKIVSNEVKENYMLREPSYGKNKQTNEIFNQPNTSNLPKCKERNCFSNHEVWGTLLKQP